MAQTPEAKVKKFVKDFMFSQFEDIWYYAAPGGMFGNTGVPDHLYFWQGVFIVIEAKADGNTPTTLQWKHLRHVARQGGVAAVVTGRDSDKMNKIRDRILERRRHDIATNS